MHLLSDIFFLYVSIFRLETSGGFRNMSDCGPTYKIMFPSKKEMKKENY